MKLAVNNDHVLLTRTFSKLFSLAGCRLGYCIGNKNDIALVQKRCTPHNVNAFGIKFAYEIMSTDGMLEKMIEKQKEGKRYLIETLRSHGYEVNDSEGNFIFIKTKTDAGKLTRKLKEMNVLVKHYTTPPYDNFIRVTTGEKEIIDKFLHVFLQADQ